MKTIRIFIVNLSFVALWYLIIFAGILAIVQLDSKKDLFTNYYNM